MRSSFAAAGVLPQDVAQAMTPKLDELPRLGARHAAAMRFFFRESLSKIAGTSIAVCWSWFRKMSAQSSRCAFRRFAQGVDLLLPDPKALDYGADLA